MPSSSSRTPSQPQPQRSFNALRVSIYVLLLALVAHFMLGRLFSSLKSQPIILQGPATQPTTAFALQSQQRNMSSDATSGSAQGSEPNVGTFANGCFWGTEHIFREHYGKGKGLIDAKVGFIGGKESSKDPSYEEVCTGRTGHAEAAQITFDPSKVTYAELVEFFYRTHDPTQLNAQGNDRGTQYRSAIFPHSDDQLAVVKRVTEEVQEKHFTPKNKKIVTQIEKRPHGDFFVADEHHQEYLYKHPNGYQCSNHRLWW